MIITSDISQPGRMIGYVAHNWFANREVLFISQTLTSALSGR